MLEKLQLLDRTWTWEKQEIGRRETSGGGERRISTVRSLNMRSSCVSSLCRRAAIAQRQKGEEQLKGKLAAEETLRQVRPNTDRLQRFHNDLFRRNVRPKNPLKTPEWLKRTNVNGVITSWLDVWRSKLVAKQSYPIYNEHAVLQSIRSTI